MCRVYLLSILLAISGFLGTLVGAGLLLLPRHLVEPGRLRQCLMERDVVAWLNRRQSLERPFYRHHHVLGMVVTAGAAALLILLGNLHAHLSAAGMLASIGVRMALLAAWLLAAMILVIGLFLIVRPSALKPLEALANRWIEIFPAATELSVPLDRMVSFLILRVPRLAGLLILIAGSVCLQMLARI